VNLGDDFDVIGAAALKVKGEDSAHVRWRKIEEKVSQLKKLHQGETHNTYSL
jgi:hypothetical protein